MSVKFLCPINSILYGSLPRDSLIISTADIMFVDYIFVIMANATYLYVYKMFADFIIIHTAGSTVAYQKFLLC